MKHQVKTGIFILITAVTSLASAANEEDEEKPSIALLEFLGSFEAENGQWVDPMEIEEMLSLIKKPSNQQEINNENNIPH